MRPARLALPLALLIAPPVMAAELTGPDLLTAISGKAFDCVQGEIPLTWTIAPVAPDAETVPYTAVVRGKTVEAEYEVTPEGRLTSDGYGDARTVDRSEDGALTVTRADGRVMVCREAE
ncbi:hypothetical protein [Shimia biformata]|uniref:hypothetical protein n=1 Tax=Shimia biformata TaxID=1294299 RepID=UPI00194E1984|nr:hypothetical protein [Shimia biformata]